MAIMPQWLELMGMVDALNPRNREDDPEAYAAACARRTELHAEMCRARGVPEGDIDPASGQEISRNSYLAARESWRNAYDCGPSPEHRKQLVVSAEHTRQTVFLALRPDLDDGEPWLPPPPADLPGVAA